MPEDTTVPRQSVAFFVNPDNEHFVECLDGSNKYDGISTFDYIDKRLKETLKHWYIMNLKYQAL